MDYVERYLHVDKRPIGHGGFGRVLIATPLSNQPLQQVPACRLSSSPNLLKEPNPPDNGKRSDRNRPVTNQTSLNSPNYSQIVPSLLASVDNRIIAATPDQNFREINHDNGATCRSRPISPASNHFRQPLALKCLHSIVKPQRLANELRCLRDLGGCNNVVKMHTAHLHMGSLFIVMDFIEHDRFSDIVTDLRYPEIVDYMKNLLIALEHVHRLNIVHRDIKPTNFLYNRLQSRFQLVDFGLAQQQRTRSNLFNATPHQALSNSGPLTTGASRLNALTEHQLDTTLGASPKTPTQIARRSIGFSIQIDPRKQIPNSSFIATANLQQSSNMISPPKAHILVKHVESPRTPNVSTKRLMPAELGTTEVDQTFKRLRVSTFEESREPVKLTVGAYESPVTNNDSLIRTRQNLTASEHKFSTPKIPRRLPSTRCGCYGKPRTCSICMGRRESNAPRSGTSGFKAPETLLRSHSQTTAIDIWAAGVIFASLLAGHTPFFRNVDDATSLAEVITIFGSQRIQNTAKQLRIKLTLQPERAPIDLAYLCRTIRRSSEKRRPLEIPDVAFELLNRMLDPSPFSRITASQALRHPMFEGASRDIRFDI